VAMLLSLGRYVLFGMEAALAVAAGGVVAPAGPAAAQPQPTMVISPASGPCDATVDVTGNDFPASKGLESLGLYLLQPGSSDVNMAILNAAVVHPEGGGGFTQSLPLREHGCEAAAMDAEAEQPAGYLAIVAAPGEAAVQPGERIANIVAVAHYAYTTTTPQRQPAMAITPSSGPCDGTVDITGRDLPASTAIHLDVAGGGGEATLGRLASLTTGASGAFALSLSLGTLGCEGARAVVPAEAPEGLRAGPQQFWIYAQREEITPLPGQEGIPGFLARAAYTYTTTAPAAPQALPSTGSGPEDRSTPRAWLALAGALAGLPLLLVAGGLLYRNRTLRS